jgi:hypothetical protein
LNAGLDIKRYAIKPSDGLVQGKVKGFYVKGQKAGKWTYYNAVGKVVERKKYKLDPRQATW